MTSPEAELDRLSASDSDGGPSLGDLFGAHHGELVRLATMLVRSRETAEDVVQDVFASIQGKAGGLARPEEALPYLRAAVLNRCRSALRRQAAARRFGDLRDPDYGLARVSAETSVGWRPGGAFPGELLRCDRPGRRVQRRWVLRRWIGWTRVGASGPSRPGAPWQGTVHRDVAGWH